MLLKDFKKHTLYFFKLALPICSGTTIAQFAALISVFLISRIYTPEQFGEFSIILAFAGFFGSISCLSFENAFILNESKINNSAIFLICLIISLMFSIITFLVLLGIDILDWFRNSSINNILSNKGFISLYIFTYGLYLASTSINFRLNHNKQLGLAKAVEPLVHHSLVIILGILGCGVSGLLISSILGLIAGLLILLYSVKKLLLNQNYYNIDLDSIKKIVIDFSNLPKFYFFTNLLVNLNFTALIIIFSFIYNSWEIGLLAFTLRILRTPYFITKPLSNLFLNIISRSKDIKDVMSIYTNILIKLILLGVLSIIIFQFIPDSLIQFIFGYRWIGINNLMKIRVSFITLELIQNIVLGIYLKLNRQKLQLLLCLSHTLTIIFSVLFIINNNIISIDEALKLVNYVNVFMLMLQLIIPLLIKKI